jgi:hypothetical protein
MQNPVYPDTAQSERVITSEKPDYPKTSKQARPDRRHPLNTTPRGRAALFQRPSRRGRRHQQQHGRRVEKNRHEQNENPRHGYLLTLRLDPLAANAITAPLGNAPAYITTN